MSTKKKHREYQGLQPKIRSDNQPKTWYNVGPPSYKLVYKAHEYYSYLRIINHSYWSYVRQLSYRKRGPHSVETTEIVTMLDVFWVRSELVDGLITIFGRKLICFNILWSSRLRFLPSKNQSIP